jgi:hypothetical protein
MTTADLLSIYAPGTTFPDILWDCTHPANDTVEWHIAEESAAIHSLTPEFQADYGHLAGERIDTGELLVWLGY